HDTILNRSVAIKVLEPSLAVDPKAVERLKREAVTAANREHPSIVRVFDVQQAGHPRYIAMRYVQRTTLRETPRDSARPPPPAALRHLLPRRRPLRDAHRRPPFRGRDHRLHALPPGARQPRAPALHQPAPAARTPARRRQGPRQEPCPALCRPARPGERP